MQSKHCVVLAALLALSGCDTASTPGVPPHERAAVAPVSTSRPSDTVPSSPPDFLKGLDCDIAARACTTPGFAISGSADPCEPDGASFGAISDDAPVDAVAHFRGTDAVATLAPGQFVCIHYTAEPTAQDGEPWLYVTAISPHGVPACRTTQCGDANARSTWSDGRDVACDTRGNRYGPGCPAGWVRGTSVDAYSMGL
ncbi:MAG: hypothetical protein ACOY37_13625 [Pseudomonadota bacterium]